MTCADRWVVAGAWALLVVGGAAGVWKISSGPPVETWVVRVEERFRSEAGRTPTPPGPPRETWQRPSGTGRAGFESAPPFAATIFTVPRGIPIARPTLTVQSLPRAVPQGVRADLDGAVIDWTLEDPILELPEHVKRVRSKPAAILVERALGGGERKAVATLDPKATRYADPAAEPNRVYQYWVVVVGPELILDGVDAVRRVTDVRKEPAGAAGVRTPPAHRVAVAGGDIRVAVLRVERYDRASKSWTPRVVTAKPGEKIGTSGWTLDGLRTVPGRFGIPILTADVTDETGARRVLAREE